MNTYLAGGVDFFTGGIDFLIGFVGRDLVDRFGIEAGGHGQAFSVRFLWANLFGASFFARYGVRD